MNTAEKITELKKFRKEVENTEKGEFDILFDKEGSLKKIDETIDVLERRKE